jgi:hypothetical protein
LKATSQTLKNERKITDISEIPEISVIFLSFFDVYGMALKTLVLIFSIA